MPEDRSSKTSRKWWLGKYFAYYRHPVINILHVALDALRSGDSQSRSRSAKDYLDTQGVLPLLRSGAKDEIPPDYTDLAFLHREVRARRPRCILEFGIGYSTVTMAHALMLNGKEGSRRGASPRLFCVDTNQGWIDNAWARVPSSLHDMIEVFHSRATIESLDGTLCHLFERLPNVNPDFIYLDGPDPMEVEGEVRGLSFQLSDGTPRPVVSADILLYEPFFRRGAFIVVDGRKYNTLFLRRRLRRKYRFRPNDSEHRHTFELLE